MKKIDIEKTNKLLEDSGAIVIKDFLSKKELSILQDIFEKNENQNINNNNNGMVFYNNQKFISQALVHSKELFNFVTGENFFSLCQKYLDKPIIKACRLYQTGGGGVSMWHHDEKNEKYISKGLIAIIYLSDVLTENDGPFEFIRGTHNNSIEMLDEDFFVENINSLYGSQISSVYGKSGTLILADSKIIHRARPHNNKIFRKSFFMQISSYNKKIYKERILINPAFVSDDFFHDRDRLSFLGFGIKSVEHIFPPTNIDHMPLNQEIISVLTKWVSKSILKKIFETLPLFLKKYLRRKFNRNVDYDSIKT